LAVEVPRGGAGGKLDIASKSVAAESPVSVARSDVDSDRAGESRDVKAKNERSAAANEDGAVDLAAKLWSNHGRQTRQFRAAVRTCFSLGLSRADIAVRIRRSVCAEPIASKSGDKLYATIYGRIENAMRTLRTSESKNAARNAGCLGAAV
jgi:hypothetical protein